MRGSTLPPEQSLTRGSARMPRVPAYTVNEDAVRHAKRLIDLMSRLVGGLEAQSGSTSASR
jgi:hypothetical protein